MMWKCIPCGARYTESSRALQDGPPVCPNCSAQAALPLDPFNRLYTHALVIDRGEAALLDGLWGWTWPDVVRLARTLEEAQAMFGKVHEDTPLAEGESLRIVEVAKAD